MPRRAVLRVRGLFLLLCLPLGLIGCGSDSGGGAVVRNVTISSNQETTANSSTASGTATVTVSSDRQRITVVINTTGLTDVTAAHIHAGLTGTSGLMKQNAPVVLTLYTASQGPFPNPLVKSLTAVDFTAQSAVGINTFADAVNAILAGRAYINIHTTANPSGEIRGQILPASFTAQLNGANEVPPTGLGAVGTVMVTVDPSSCTLTVSGSTTGLQVATVTLAHIHAGAVGVNGPPIFTVFDASQGAYIGSFNKSLTAADLTTDASAGINNCYDAINAILTGAAYFNVHTTVNPLGAIRGQFTATQNQ